MQTIHVFFMKLEYPLGQYRMLSEENAVPVQSLLSEVTTNGYLE